jgi:hypothetical protein
MNTKPFFSPNIDSKGRLLRGLGALSLITGAGFAFTHSGWLSLVLAGSGAFVLFEALRGWCVLRACRINHLRQR